MKQSGMPAMFIWMLMPRKVYYPTVITKKNKNKNAEGKECRKNWKYRLQEKLKVQITENIQKR